MPTSHQSATILNFWLCPVHKYRWLYVSPTTNFTQHVRNMSEYSKLQQNPHKNYKTSEHGKNTQYHKQIDAKNGPAGPIIIFLKKIVHESQSFYHLRLSQQGICEMWRLDSEEHRDFLPLRFSQIFYCHYCYTDYRFFNKFLHWICKEI